MLQQQYQPVPVPVPAQPYPTGPYPVYTVQPQPFNYYQQPQPIRPQTVVVVQNQRQVSFIARVFWYLFIGWWLGGFWITVGYFLCLTMLGLPLGLLMLNRLPQVMTLKAKGADTGVEVLADGSVRVKSGGPRQHNFFLRAVYFLFFGWYVSGFWITLAYFFIFTIIGLPVGLMMLNVLPTVMTLRRNRNEIDIDRATPTYQQMQPAGFGQPFEQGELTDEQINFRLSMLIGAWSLVPISLIVLLIVHRF